MRIYLLIASILSLFFLKAQNLPVDFRNYHFFLSKLDSDTSQTISDKILKIDSIESYYGRLLPNEYRRKGLYYHQLNEVDSARENFNKAINLGCDIYDEALISKYNLMPINNGSFHLQNIGYLLLIEHIERIDQLIRNNGSYKIMNLEQSKSLDTINGSLIIRNNLLKESVSGYLQRSCILILYHSWYLYLEDSIKLEKYLLNLVKMGELHPYVMAHLIDYWNNTIHGYQIYGTLGNVYGNAFEFYAPFKTANVEYVNEVREKLGLNDLLSEIKSFECVKYEGFNQYGGQ